MGRGDHSSSLYVAVCLAAAHGIAFVTPNKVENKIIMKGDMAKKEIKDPSK